MKCLCMVVVVSLLCPISWPVIAFRALTFGVHLCLMSAMRSLNVRRLSYVTPRIFILLVQEMGVLYRVTGVRLLWLYYCL